MISKDLLNQVLKDWSFFEAPPNTGIQRMVSLPEKLHSDLALLIQGVRRGGKSTLLSQLPKHYGLSLLHCFFCNFEDPRLIEALGHDLLSQIVSLAREKVPAHLPCYFFLDEIQNVQNWEKWLHSQLERPKENYFVVTGSNSALLGGKFGSSLTGRLVKRELFPFCYREFKKVFPEKNLETYLSLGGFPRVLHYESPYKLLQEYFEDIVLRDVFGRMQTRKPETIRQVLKMAFETAGSQLSYRKIGSAVGLSVETVKNYLNGCIGAYLLFECPFFAFSEKKQLERQKKYYPIDPGLSNAVTNTTKRNFGKNLERLVFLTLKQRFGQVFYWEQAHQGEIDFVVQQGNQIIPFQVTWSETPKLRHEKAFCAFYEKYPQAQEVVWITKENAEAFFDQFP